MAYVECSAKTTKGVKDVFEYALMAALEPEKLKKLFVKNAVNQAETKQDQGCCIIL